MTDHPLSLCAVCGRRLAMLVLRVAADQLSATIEGTHVGDLFGPTCTWTVTGAANVQRLRAPPETPT